MTVQEAIKILNPETSSEALLEIEYYGGFNGKMAQIQAIIDASIIAVECMEEQIPKTPCIEGDGYADGHLVYDTWICPNCDAEYEIDYDDYDYCPKCGQAIDKSVMQGSEEE